MKVLLFYPELKGEQDSTPLYRGLPLSVLTLAAQLDPTIYDVLVVDGRLEKDYAKNLAQWLDSSVLCCGISAITSYQIKDGLLFASLVRALNPTIPIIWGGWHPSLMPEQTIDHELADLVVVGQGEKTFTMLVERIARNQDYLCVPNLYFKDGQGKTGFTPQMPLTELHDLNPIENAYRYVRMEDYIHPLWGNKKVVNYESSRGCPFHCSFCSIGSMYRKRWNALSPETVAGGIDHLYQSYDIDSVHFFDNNFFVSKKRATAISAGFLEKNIKIRWDGTTTVEHFNRFSETYIEQLKLGGFYRTIIGVESGDEEVLEKINKKHRNSQVLEVVKKCADHEIFLSLSFMVGFPWNPDKDVNATVELIEQIKRIAPDTEILLFILSPYLGTPLFQVAVDYGMQFPETLEGWANHTYDQVQIPWISKSLHRKINRYISFFGTKDLSEHAINFLKGG